MRDRQTTASIAGLAAALLAWAGTAPARTAVGDWGHFLSYRPRVHLLNQERGTFTLTVHVMRWGVEKWNARDIAVRLTDPKGRAVLDGRHKLRGDSRMFVITDALPGVYVLEVNRTPKGFGGANFWVSSSLDRSVVWTGEPNGNAIESHWFVAQASVPRRWWFFVPKGTKRFRCRAQRADRYMSQRERWGYSIFSPSGRRARVLWGQPPITGAGPGKKGYRAEMVAAVEVFPGQSGRFWSVEVRNGDAHNYSNINLCLEGVPPYLARSPEEWLDPNTGRLADVKVWDDDPFMQFARTEKIRAWPGLHHFTSCPSLGDPDGIQIRGDGRFALWNVRDDRLKLRVGTYLPRTLGTGRPGGQARVKIATHKGRILLDARKPMVHLHGPEGAPEPIPRSDSRLLFVDVSGTERWLAFTYPAVPTVWIGQDAGGGWRRFRFEVGTARSWYFFVPPRTRSFALRAAVRHEDEMVRLSVNAPDRTMALLYGRRGEKTVPVPDGLDGKVWNVHCDIGSGSRIRPGADLPPKYLALYLTLDLKGVPGLLAPTWEQWFDPEWPGAPNRRAWIFAIKKRHSRTRPAAPPGEASR